MGRTIFAEAIGDPREGWQHWPDRMPPLNWLGLEIWRSEWPGPQIVTPAEVASPYINVWGLYWREP